MAEGSRSRSPSTWLTRTAGALLVLIGCANAVLGVLALATDMVHLAPAASGGLLVLGLATAAAGMLVWRGSRLALALALTTFGLLLVVQVGDVVATGAVEDGTGPRLVLLVLLVTALAAAQLGRHPRTGQPSRPAAHPKD